MYPQDSGGHTVGPLLLSVECRVSVHSGVGGLGCYLSKEWLLSINADSTQERSYQVRLESLSEKTSWRR